VIRSCVRTFSPPRQFEAFRGLTQLSGDSIAVKSHARPYETLRRYPNRFGLTDEETRTEVETLQYFAEFVDPDEEITAVEDDPDDDKFLEAAVAGDAQSLVSGDEHLLALDSFRDIEIVTPRTFYERLESG
jgi:predicted nucleic acid-binding protein